MEEHTNTTSTGLEQQSTLSRELRNLSDKSKVKLLLKTMEDNNLQESPQSRGMIGFCLGYLGGLLVVHDLNDWDD